MRDDAKNLYAASLAEVHGVKFTIGIAHEAVSAEAFEHAGIDVSVNPRTVTAEEIIRFAHDPRTKQVALLEGNRYEVIDVTLRDTSEYIGKAFKEMPVRGALIGAVVRNGSAIFPHGDDVLQAGRPRDRVHAGRGRATGRQRAVTSGAAVTRRLRPTAPTGGRRARAASTSSRMLAKYLGVAALFPAAVALWYARAGLAVPGHRRDRRAARARARAPDGGATSGASACARASSSSR